MAWVLSMVVVALLLGAAPAFARGPGGDRGTAQGRADRVEEPKRAKGSEPAATEPATVTATATVSTSSLPSLVQGGNLRRRGRHPGVGRSRRRGPRRTAAAEVTAVPVTVSAGVGAMPEKAGNGERLVVAVWSRPTRRVRTRQGRSPGRMRRREPAPSLHGDCGFGEGFPAGGC